MGEKEKIEAWIQKMYWISQLPEDDYKKLRRNAAEGSRSFESKFEELRRKYGKKIRHPQHCNADGCPLIKYPPT